MVRHTMNLEEALKASKNGARAAFISGVATVVVSVYALSSNTDGLFRLWNDWTIIAEIFIIFVCAFGMLRTSRAAALTMCIYFVFTKIIMFMEFGRATGVITALVFLFFFGKAAQGTFAYHRIKKEEDSSYQPASRLGV